MPKASTLYAGFSARHDLYVFINFQHSSKAWEVGRFTINLILSKHEREPETWGGPFAPEDGKSFAEGSYRISGVLGQHPEKWWHLKKDRRPIITQAWRPTSYDDNAVVLNDS